MGEPKAITYKEVAKGRSNAEAGELWRTIGDITGAGHLSAHDEATIDLTGLADGKLERIEQLLNPEQEVVIDEKKRGAK